MHSYNRFPCPGPLGPKGGQLSTYESDFKSPTNRPLRLFKLHPGPSHTTHKKMADMLSEYHKHTFKTWTSGPRNPASVFPQGKTKMSVMMEKEREKLMGTQIDKTPPVRRDLDIKTPRQILWPDTVEEKPSPSVTMVSGDKLLSPSLSRHSIHSGMAQHPPVHRRAAWCQAMGDLQRNNNFVIKEQPEVDRSHEDHLPNIREVCEKDLLQQGDRLRIEQFRRNATQASRQEGLLNRRVGTKSNYMHIGLMFDSMTTYSQSYTHKDCAPVHRGLTRVNFENTPPWENLSSEYSARYKGAQQYLPGKSKPPSGLEDQLYEVSSSHCGSRTRHERKSVSQSEYQREFNKMPLSKASTVPSTWRSTQG